MIKRYMPAVAVAVALLAGACGSGGSGSTSGVASIDGKGASSKSKSGQKLDPQEASLAYAKCMRANGVDVPDPDASGMVRVQPGGKRPDPEAMKKAEQACKAERDALQGSMGEPDKNFQDKALKMARCMRGQGIDMPDPTLSEGGGASVKVDPDQLDSPEYKAAEETCRKQAGMPEPGATAGSSK